MCGLQMKLILNIPLEYKVNKTHENAIRHLLSSCTGRVDAHLSGDVRNPARKIKTCTILVLSAIYPLLLLEIKTRHKQMSHTKDDDKLKTQTTQFPVCNNSTTAA